MNVFIVLTANQVFWTEDIEEALQLGKAYHGLVAPAPVLLDYRNFPKAPTSPVCFVRPGDSICYDMTHCSKFGCLKYNSDGSIKGVGSARHRIWDGGHGEKAS